MSNQMQTEEKGLDVRQSERIICSVNQRNNLPITARRIGFRRMGFRKEAEPSPLATGLPEGKSSGLDHRSPDWCAQARVLTGRRFRQGPSPPAMALLKGIATDSGNGRETDSGNGRDRNQLGKGRASAGPAHHGLVSRARRRARPVAHQTFCDLRYYQQSDLE